MNDAMTELDRISTWVDGYVRAWNSNTPADIGALFAEDATYYTEPYRDPWRGRGAIVEHWLQHQDAPGETTFTWHPIVVGDNLAIIQGTTTYPDRTFSNLWVIRLDADGRCREFTEWWMEQPAAG